MPDPQTAPRTPTIRASILRDAVSGRWALSARFADGRTVRGEFGTTEEAWSALVARIEARRVGASANG